MENKEKTKEFKMFTGKELLNNIRGKDKKETTNKDKKTGVGGR